FSSRSRHTSFSRDWSSDVCSSDLSCFVGASPILPVRRGEIQCKMLGVDAKAFDDAGQEVIGERGELVCTQPLPSMPVFFWNDAEIGRASCREGEEIYGEDAARDGQ